MKIYLVENKADDYGNCNKELVQTTLKNATQYYWYKEVQEPDINVLKRYFTLIEYDEEKDRTEDQRFYGHS